MGPETKLMLVLLLLMLSAFFSSAETALTTVNKMRMRALADEGNNSARIVLKLIDNSGKMLSAILIGNNIVNISASSIMTIVAQEVWGNFAVSIATGVLTIVILIFGEITPKTLATLYSESLSLKYARIVYFIVWLLTPVIFIINKFSMFIMFVLRIDPKKKQATITEGELRTIVDVSHEEGVIETEERTMIKNVFDFGDTLAKDVMIPRIDMCMIDITSSYDELLSIFREHKYTRFPVFSDSTDNVVGIINIKDLLLYKSGESFNIKDYLRQAYFTYEHKNLSDLMLEMKTAAINIIIVLDEYGAATGLITIEDLIEEIVGDIRDEYDYDEEDSIKIINENEFLVEGLMNLDDFNDELGTNLKAQDNDSLGGFILEQLDRLAIEGDKVETNELTLIVESVEKNRINKVHVYRNEVSGS